ncbi:hypothetical protein DPMN_119519 [Dreissena polymorpha]|uniref:Uncharacterized protein n=1 Tax=Dreissena polymorpha TaxID=45954 RepID=A0A9D4GM22_DREPO|nr:hypothetical protein DPMN_119519 [Dreissena polymorpha]
MGPGTADFAVTPFPALDHALMRSGVVMPTPGFELASTRLDRLLISAYIATFRVRHHLQYFP